MAKTYYVQNKRTHEVLNQKGGWSANLASYRLAEFDSEDAATAAFVDGVECVVVSAPKAEASTITPPVVPDRVARLAARQAGALARTAAAAPSGPRFVVTKGTKFLDAQDQFEARTMRQAASFASESDALDKVEALGVSLDRVIVVNASRD